MSESIWSKWRWNQLRGWGKSRVVGLTFLIPVIGYFIIFGENFNDFLQLEFSQDVHETEQGGVPEISYWRAYFLYFGFSFLALGSGLFTYLCPDIVKAYPSAAEFVAQEERTKSEQMIEGMRRQVLRWHYCGDNYSHRSAKDFFVFSRHVEFLDGNIVTLDVPENADETFEGKLQAMKSATVDVYQKRLPVLMADFYFSEQNSRPGQRLIVTISDDELLVNANVKIDGSGDRRFRTELQKYLRTQLGGNRIKKVRFVDSRSSNLIQLADMAAGAIHRCYRTDRKDNDRWRKQLNKRIGDIWVFPSN